MFNKKIQLFTAILVSIAISPVFSQGKAPIGTKEIQSSRKIQFQNKSARKASPEIIQENTGKGKELSTLIISAPNSMASLKLLIR